MILLNGCIGYCDYNNAYRISLYRIDICETVWSGELEKCAELWTGNELETRYPANAFKYFNKLEKLMGDVLFICHLLQGISDYWLTLWVNNEEKLILQSITAAVKQPRALSKEFLTINHPQGSDVVFLMPWHDHSRCVSRSLDKKVSHLTQLEWSIFKHFEDRLGLSQFKVDSIWFSRNFIDYSCWHFDKCDCCNIHHINTSWLSDFR